MSSVTDRNKNIPLESDGTQCRTKEKVGDPNPWADNGTLPASFKVPKEHVHNHEDYRSWGALQKLVHPNWRHKRRYDSNNDKNCQLDVFRA